MVAKMPVPMIAPTPRAMRLQGPSTFLRDAPSLLGLREDSVDRLGPEELQTHAPDGRYHRARVMPRLRPLRDPVTIHFEGEPVLAERGEPAAVGADRRGPPGARAQPEVSPTPRPGVPSRRVRRLPGARRRRAQRHDVPRARRRGDAHRGAERRRVEGHRPASRRRLVFPRRDEPPRAFRRRARPATGPPGVRPASGRARAGCPAESRRPAARDDARSTRWSSGRDRRAWPPPSALAARGRKVEVVDDDLGVGRERPCPRRRWRARLGGRVATPSAPRSRGAGPRLAAHDRGGHLRRRRPSGERRQREGVESRWSRRARSSSRRARTTPRSPSRATTCRAS